MLFYLYDTLNLCTVLYLDFLHKTLSIFLYFTSLCFHCLLCHLCFLLCIRVWKTSHHLAPFTCRWLGFYSGFKTLLAPTFVRGCFLRLGGNVFLCFCARAQWNKSYNSVLLLATELSI